MKLIGTFTFYNETALLVHQLETMLLFCDEIIMLSDNAIPEALEIAEAYTNNKTVRLLKHIKQDNFKERNEWGDRQLLLQGVKERKGDIHYHTDADEIFLTRDVKDLLDIVKNSKENELLYFPLNTFWGNAYNYRIPYNTTVNAGKQLPDIPSGSTMPYFYHTKLALSFPSRAIPNFHAPRLPNFTNSTAMIRKDYTIPVLHYGYYTKNTIEAKKKFYNTNTSQTGNIWGKDMQVTTEEYIQNWGMGIQERKQ